MNYVGLGKNLIKKIHPVYLLRMFVNIFYNCCKDHCSSLRKHSNAVNGAFDGNNITVYDNNNPYTYKESITLNQTFAFDSLVLL
jgi:hypothetical protein